MAICIYRFAAELYVMTALSVYELFMQTRERSQRSYHGHDFISVKYHKVIIVTKYIQNVILN